MNPRAFQVHCLLVVLTAAVVGATVAVVRIVRGVNAVPLNNVETISAARSEEIVRDLVGTDRTQGTFNVQHAIIASRWDGHSTWIAGHLQFADPVDAQASLRARLTPAGNTEPRMRNGMVDTSGITPPAWWQRTPSCRHVTFTRRRSNTGPMCLFDYSADDGSFLYFDVWR